MKRCPRCERTYPDSEKFCDADGTALVPAGPAFVESRGTRQRRRRADRMSRVRRQGAAGRTDLQFLRRAARASNRPRRRTHRRHRGRRRHAIRQPRGAVRRRRCRLPAGCRNEATAKKKAAGCWASSAYLIAAIVALGGGAWLAINLSSKTAVAAGGASRRHPRSRRWQPRCRRGRWWRWRTR